MNAAVALGDKGSTLTGLPLWLLLAALAGAITGQLAAGLAREWATAARAHRAHDCHPLVDDVVDDLLRCPVCGRDLEDEIAADRMGCEP